MRWLAAGSPSPPHRTPGGKDFGCRQIPAAVEEPGPDMECLGTWAEGIVASCLCDWAQADSEAWVGLVSQVEAAGLGSG